MTEIAHKTSSSSWTARSLTVLVPALNERGNIGPTVKRLIGALNITVEDYEIVIINDGSSDGTDEAADLLAREHPQVKIIHNPRTMGLGSCYLLGVDIACKNFFVYIPGDNTWPNRSFLELFGNLGKADLVTSYSSNPNVRPLGRRIVSSLYTRVLNILFGKRMHYYNGLTIYPISFLRTKPISTYGFGFQAEALLKAIYNGLSFIEVGLPIDERTAGKSKAVTVRNVSSVIATVLRLFWKLRVVRKNQIRSQGPASVHGSLRVTTNPNPSVEEVGFQSPRTNVRSRTAESEGASRVLRVIITGSSSGIGKALAESLAAEGHQLFVCARRIDVLNKISQQYDLVHSWQCDISNEEQVQAFTDQVQTITPSVDVLINCAGGFGAIGPLEMTESAEWLRTLHVNLFGTYLMIKYTLPLLGRSPCPMIINFAGGGAFSPVPNYSAYACSKAAVIRLTECLAAELAQRGIAVNAVAPGIVATEAHKATLDAGEERAGILQYRRAQTILDNGGAPMENVVDCVRTLLSADMHGFTGKTISANFDPWSTEAFKQHISDITRSDLYTMRRINIANLPEGDLKTALAKAWANHATQP